MSQVSQNSEYNLYGTCLMPERYCSHEHAHVRPASVKPTKLGGRVTTGTAMIPFPTFHGLLRFDIAAPGGHGDKAGGSTILPL